MAVHIQAPDGSVVEFPDGTDDTIIKTAMSKAYLTVAGGTPALRTGTSVEEAPAAPSAQPVKKTEPHSDFGLGFDQGVVQPILNAGVGIEKALGLLGIPSINKAIGGHTASEIRDAHSVWLAEQADPNAPDNERPGEARTPGILGQIAGGIPSTALAIAATKNPLMAGAGLGALNSAGKNWKEVATDTALGAAASKVGDVGLKAVGSVVAPVWRQSVNKLLGEGVKLTPGQITGGALHRLEDASMSFPIIGDMVSNASKRAQDSFNIAAANRALFPIGEKIPTSVKAGHEAVAYVQNRLGREYDQILPQMSIAFDNQVHSDIQSLMTQAKQELPPDHYNALDHFVKREIIGAFNRGTKAGQPNLTGEALKDMDQVINKEVRAFGPSNSPWDRKYADFLSDFKGAVHDTMGRQNPALQPRLNAVDTAYANLTRVERAAAPANQGKFTPVGLQKAARDADTSVRKRTSAKGSAMMQDLAVAGQDAMNRTVPDSGTAYRALVNTATGAALYGAAPKIALNPLAAGAVAAAITPYTKTGGNITRALMTKRPGFAPSIRRAVDRAAPAVTATAPIGVVEQKRQARLRGTQE